MLTERPTSKPSDNYSQLKFKPKTLIVFLLYNNIINMQQLK